MAILEKIVRNIAAAGAIVVGALTGIACTQETRHLEIPAAIEENPASGEAKETSKGRIFFRRGEGESSEIWSMDSEGKSLEQITQNDYKETGAAVSNDGRFLAYTEIVLAKDSPNPWEVPSHLHVINLKSGKESVHTGPIRHHYSHIAWSPKNDKLGASVLLYNGGIPAEEISHVGGVTTNGIIVVCFNPETMEIDQEVRIGNGYWSIGEYYPSFSPDGKQMIYQSHKAMHINRETIPGTGTHFPGDSSFTSCNSHNPVWSPRGDKIIFTSERKNWDEHQIYIMDSDGTNQEILVPDVYKSRTYPSPGCWSPDGKKVAYISAKHDLCIVDIENREITNLTEKLGLSPIHNREINDWIEGHGLSPRYKYGWSPEGNSIVFESGSGEKSELYTIRADGTGLKKLADNLEARRFVGWVPNL
jgi:Tol biopolymer transport system component